MDNSKAVEGPATAQFQVHEIGSVIAVRECIVRVKGMPSCINGQIVDFERGGRGMARVQLVFGIQQHIGIYQDHRWSSPSSCASSSWTLSRFLPAFNPILWGRVR